MNGKQAKRLRRAAVGLATVLDEAGRPIVRDGYNEVRTPTAVGSDTYSVQLINKPNSLKGIYRKLKTGKA